MEIDESVLAYLEWVRWRIEEGPLLTVNRIATVDVKEKGCQLAIAGPLMEQFYGSTDIKEPKILVLCLAEATRRNDGLKVAKCRVGLLEQRG